MALQKDILVSLHGRKLGLTREGFLVGDGFQGGAIGNGQFMGALKSSATGITADTGRAQGTAVQLSAVMNRVDNSTAPAAGTITGDGVALPPSIPGLNVGEFHNTADHLMLGEPRWGVLSKAAYLANDYRQEVEVIVDRDGRREKRIYGGIDPRRVREFGLGDALAFGDTGYRRIDALYEDWSFPAAQQLYALVLGGSRTMQIAGGYVVSGWADDRAFDYEAWEPRK